MPPYGVAKHRLSEIEPFESDRGSEWQLGRRRGYLRLPQLAKRIWVTKSGRQAHILTADGFVRTIDPATMVEIAPAIRLQPDHPFSLKLPLKTGLVYEGDLTDDERYLVTTGLAGEWFLNVADLVERSTWTVRLPEGPGSTADLAINKGWLNRGLLALRILGDRPAPYRGYVAVYRFQLEGPSEELGRFTITEEFAPPGRTGPTELPGSALAWSGSGGELILATSICPVPSEGPHCDDPEHSAEWTISAVEDGGRRLVHRHDVTVCRSIGDGDSLNVTGDFLTANGRIPPPATPSPVPSPSATASSLHTATATATAWPSPSAVITPSPSPVPSPTATLPGSQPPRRLYLPLAVRSSCQLRRQFADVVLVLDASPSMAQPTSAGRSKPAAALETAPRRTENLPALILLTDRLPNRVPTSTPTGSQEDTVLRWAQLARSRAVSVYTVGLGEPNGGAGQGIDIPLLRAIATRPEMFYHAPAAEPLAAIYRQIAPTIGCPPAPGAATSGLQPNLCLPLQSDPVEAGAG